MAKPTAKTAVIDYKSPRAVQSRRMALFAIASFLVVFPLPIIYSIVEAGSLVGFVQAFFLLLSILSLVFLLVSLAIYNKNRSSRLVLTESGIVLPGIYGGFKKQSSGINWGQVEKISVEKADSGSSSEKSGEIILYISKGNPVRLKMSSLAPEDLDKLVSACDLWCNKSSRDKSFDTFVDEIVRGRIEEKDSSFTGIWMEEAQRRISTTPFVPLEPGTHLQDGRIKVLQPLTAGGWSAIYLSEWKNRTPVILKEAVVPPSSAETLKQKAKEHFEREAVLLSGLNNPKIAKVMDYFVENGRQYMLLERINGSTLRSYVRDRGSVSMGQALSWGLEIIDIVEYLHNQEIPIIHRDLTPENLVLDMRGSLILVDFGAANEFVGTVTGTLVGKPSYISPEQFSGRATLQSDLYSVGAVMYFMLTGVEPEPLSVNSPRTMNKVVSEDLDFWVQELMQLNLDKRIKSAKGAKEKLSAIYTEFNKLAPQLGLEDKS